MLGKLSIAGVVAAILMIPTALSAQVGNAVNPGAAVRRCGSQKAAPTDSVASMAIGAVRNPQSVVLKRVKPASLRPARNAAVQRWGSRL